MSSLWDRTLIYLGLKEEPEEGADERPEAFVPEDEPQAEPAAARRRSAGSSARAGEDRGDKATVRALRTADVHVRPVPSVSVARAAVIELAGFDEVEAVGTRFLTGQAVLFDLSEAPTNEARRVVDFVSGLTYASRGRLTKVASRAFLVVPDGMHLPAEERRRLGDLGYRLPSKDEG